MTEQPNEDMGEVLRFPQRGQHQADQVNQADEVVDEHDLVVPDKPATGGPEPLTGEVLPRWQGPADRRPIVPAWLVSREDRRAAARWAAGHVGHVAAFHATRTPLYAGRLAAYSPRGAARIIAAVGRWLVDAEAHPLRRAMVDAGDTSGYLALSRQWRERVKARLMLAGVSAGTGAGGGLAVWELAPHGVAYAGLAGVVATLGWVGRRSDRPLVEPAVLTTRARKLTADTVTRALRAALRLPDSAELTFGEPISRDGAGWRAVVDLPFGTTADKAIGRRVEIASGLDYDERQVFLSRHRGNAGSARRLVMWVADVDPLSVPAGRSPLVTAPRVNYWEPFPFGLDERGNTVPLSLLWAAMLVGAIPRMGKTFTARLPVLAAALDPHVRLYVYDMKGSPDWMPFRHVAHRFGVGDRPDPDTGVDPVERLLADMRELQAEVDHRYRTLRTLPAEVCPEGKLTEDLSRNRHLNMPLVLVVIDEVQRALEHKEHGDELAEVLTDLVKVAPAVGVMFLCATQKPDKTSTPSSFRDQFGIRFALRVTSWQVSDLVLGAGAYSEGLDASRLSVDALGCGLLRGTGDTGSVVGGTTVRAFLADGRDAEVICQRGRALREAAGTLTGAAIGEVPAPVGPAWSVLADLLTVFGDQDKAHSDVLCARLADAWPDRYAEWTPTTLAAALKPHQVDTRQVWATGSDGQPTNRRGVVRADLVNATT